MGKKDKQKKKGAQKTAEKTEKKASQKLKKELKSKGEESIEEIIAHFQEEDRKRQQVIEEIVSPPSKRSNFTFTSHPEKEEIIFFGGEYFNGNKTFMYNELFFYNIKKNHWLSVKAPNPPPPRSAHQAVVLAHGGGQLWIFGGEFVSPTQSQFYHYKDLWVFHFKDKNWERIQVPGGPSSRSGHRMVAAKKQIFVFGGYHDTTREYKYFNDLYKFDLDTYKWTLINLQGTVPAPRSGCQMAPLSDGRLLIFGGYSKEKQKKDVDKGTVHSDMFIFHEDKNDEAKKKWKSTLVRQSLCRPSPRCSFGMVISSPDYAVVFGGIQDKEESDEELTGICLKDMFLLDMTRGSWKELSLSRRHLPNAKNINDNKDLPKVDKEDIVKALSSTNIHSETSTDSPDGVSEVQHLSTVENDSSEISVTVHEDDVFTVTIGPQTSHSSDDCLVSSSSGPSDYRETAFWPPARMNPGVTVNRGIFYIYGGIVEDGDKQLTLSDMYSIDLKKMEQWQTIIPLEDGEQEWYASSSSEDEEDPAEAVEAKEDDQESESDNSDSDTE